MVTNFWPTVCIFSTVNMNRGFSWPSTAPLASAGWASAQLICVGLAPRVLNMSEKMGEPTTRIFRPLRSSGLRIARLELLTSR
ncbi:hypothetical protein D3C78_1544700 [compost metagenome]